MGCKPNSNPSPAEPEGLVLDTPEPPADLPYANFEDFRARELLKANGIALTQDSLIATLHKGEMVLQGAAAHALGAIAATAAIPALQETVEKAQDLVQTEAAYALVRLGQDRYREILKQALGRRPDANLSPAIAAGDLARLGDPSGFPVLEKCFASDNLLTRMIACKQLTFFVPFEGSQIGEKRVAVYSLFARALKDEHADVRRLAARQLREVGTPEAQDLLSPQSQH